METIKTYKVGDKITAYDVAQTIDHSLLRPDITVKELVEGCDIAKKYNCVSVCVRPSDLPIVVKELDGSGVLVTTVASFPHGVCTTETKVFETQDAIRKGAKEVDVVMNIGRFLSGEYDYVEEELTAIAKAAHDLGGLIKVILEIHYLTPEQIKKACQIAERAGMDFVKTSTGYAGSGATVEAIKLMRASVSPKVQVKASGGIRTLDMSLAVMAAGAIRNGTRSTIAILDEALKREKEGTLIIAE
ncbi:deoxyribose-phosphate aldolase [Zongyangia hominis]|uniref:Deoxyribose-phosphate aldolase n=1 Tax=Zongyangia hominis TaxID=2763677 RepID=A0A926EDN7_9FIRM|nr:deoxyribose-phosphate aldolase [Zongyangia hominis]MBC8569847.1 deoxyribose-phosphate aldolase [Zongyangia hominis]